jgi:hypothetical protein
MRWLGLVWVLVAGCGSTRGGEDAAPDAPPSVQCDAGGITVRGTRPADHGLVGLALGGREGVRAVVPTGIDVELVSSDPSVVSVERATDGFVLVGRALGSATFDVRAGGCSFTALRMDVSSIDHVAVATRASHGFAPIHYGYVRGVWAGADVELSIVLLDFFTSAQWDDGLSIDGHPFVGVDDAGVEGGVLVRATAPASGALTLQGHYGDPSSPTPLTVSLPVHDAADAIMWRGLSGTVRAGDAFRVCALASHGGVLLAGAPITPHWPSLLVASTTATTPQGCWEVNAAAAGSGTVAFELGTVTSSVDVVVTP